MIAVLAALALAAAQAPSAPTPPTAASPAPPASVPSAPVASADDAAGDDDASLETLRQVYQTSCADRDFYTFSDVCDQLRQQVHAAEVAADRAARAAARKKNTPGPKSTPPAATPPG